MPSKFHPDRRQWGTVCRFGSVWRLVFSQVSKLPFIKSVNGTRTHYNGCRQNTWKMHGRHSELIIKKQTQRRL